MNQSAQGGRYAASSAPVVDERWQLTALTPPSRLFGANGICAGPDGRLYVAQVSGSQVSAVDINTGAIETISPKGGDIVAPDDLVFDGQGNLYATELTEGRVCVREPGGRTRVLCTGLPCANPITFHQGRLFAGECRPGGRIMELDLNGGAPRIILENVPLPNAMQVGPDGMLYFPVMGANEIWRISPEGGEAEKVAGDLGVPDAIKFDAQGKIVSTQVASGQVLQIDPQTGRQSVLADIAPGLDNLAFVGDRLFVSSISGQINEIVAPGEVRSLVPDGFSWPLGLAMGDDGELFVADGSFTYALRPGGVPKVTGMLFSQGFPGYTRGVAVSGPGEFVVTTSNGQVARWRPAQQETDYLAEGFDQLYGVAVTGSGAIMFAERGTGRALGLESGAAVELASGLKLPSGVAAYGDVCLIAEEGGGRVVSVSGGNVVTVLDGLQAPQGIVVRGDFLYVVDVGAGELVEYDMANDSRVTIASHLPLGAPAGVVPKFIGAIGDMSGPAGPFAGIAAGPDGTLYVSADADGSVLAIRKT